MPDETSVAAGKRFSRDMRLIREDRGMSIDDIHAETRIARTLIESFEQGGLYNHPTFNEVYLRSFVRAYADAVGISQDDALDGLESALDGAYDDALAVRYKQAPSAEDEERLGGADEETNDAEPTEESTATDPPESIGPPAPVESSETPSSAPPAAGGPEGRGGIVGPPRAVGEGKQMEEETDDSSSSSSEREPSTSRPSRSSSSEEQESTEESASTYSRESDGDESPDEEHVSDSDWQEAATASSEKPPSEPETFEEEDDAAASQRQQSPSSGTFSDETEPEEAPVDLSGTGIVGEPTAIGESSQEGTSPSASASPVAEGPVAEEARSSSQSGALLGQSREVVWAGLGFLVVLLVLVGLGIAYFSGGSAPVEEETPTAAASDTSATESQVDTAVTTSSESLPPPADVTLGETMHLTVLARADVNEMRIQRDDDLRRPYWIEEGEAGVFPFQQRIVLENELSDAELFLEGHPYPGSEGDPSGPVTLTRSDVESFVDTLRGTSASLSVTPDTIPVGAPDISQE